MKKAAVTILALLYLAVSSGIAMELHYCMGNQAGVEFFGSSSDTCNTCGMTEKDTGCCHDDFKFYKLNDSHKTAANDINFAASEFAIVGCDYQFNWQTPVYSVAVTASKYSPPDYSGPSANILNCVFRI